MMWGCDIAHIWRSGCRIVVQHRLCAAIETIDWIPGPAPLSLDRREQGITAVIWATGYRHDYSLIDARVLSERGYPMQHRGGSDEPGLNFIGFHGMHTAGSGFLSGVGADAQHTVEARRAARIQGERSRNHFAASMASMLLRRRFAVIGVPGIWLGKAAVSPNLPRVDDDFDGVFVHRLGDGSSGLVEAEAVGHKASQS